MPHLLLFYNYCFISSLSPLALSRYVLQQLLAKSLALSFCGPTFRIKMEPYYLIAYSSIASLSLHAQALICCLLIVIKDFFSSVKNQHCYIFTLVFKTVLIRQKISSAFVGFFLELYNAALVFPIIQPDFHPN